MRFPDAMAPLRMVLARIASEIDKSLIKLIDVDFSTSVLSKMAVTKKIHIAVEQNARGPDKEAVMQRLKKWEENILFSAIGSAPTLGYAEATAIIDMMRSFGEDFFHNR